MQFRNDLVGVEPLLTTRILLCWHPALAEHVSDERSPTNTMPVMWWGGMENPGRIIRLWRREEKVNVSVWIAPLK